MNSGNQPQRAPESDFLDGIDDQFQRLMKQSSNGKRSSRGNGRSSEDPITTEILEHVHTLSKTQREQLLAYMRSLKQKAD